MEELCQGEEDCNNIMNWLDVGGDKLKCFVGLTVGLTLWHLMGITIQIEYSEQAWRSKCLYFQR